MSLTRLDLAPLAGRPGLRRAVSVSTAGQLAQLHLHIGPARMSVDLRPEDVARLVGMLQGAQTELACTYFADLFATEEPAHA